ncbi:flavocytochrome c [Sutterella sp.]|uniref:FAD-dependent oxidoreductase n=1 Tax=Sutterella sp. TaxID=1981025 RepID=UPI0026E054FA|nr:flavocytochrome c [Sutterella sp.]MDO5531170.1 flavocytochrome c [Sutterella sp.]
MTDKRINRRSMLKMAGAGTALAAASGFARAQCAPGIVWDETHEIIVVGSGGAGMAAAVKAAQKGAKDVVVLEKLAFTGGNTLVSQGFMNASDPVRQPRQGIKDSPENHMKQTLAAGDFRGDPERVRVLCENAYGAVTWLESLGMKFKDNVIQIFGALYPRSHIPALPKGQGYGTILSKAAKDLGVKVQTGVSVTEIIRERPFEGDVLGVKVTKSGKSRYIRATRAVVLAAGGFGANKYLRELHDPRVRGLGTDNLPGSTGEVAMAAVRVGGYLVGMDFIQSTPGAPAGKKMKLLLNFNVNGSIYVDKRGNRIVNEGERRDVIRDAVLGTPERYAYTVCDNENFESYDEVNRKAIHEGIKINEAWTAPTIRELAEKMGVDPDGLEKTIDRYNNVFVKNGRDDDFQKTAVNLTKRIEKGPFWACYTGMTVHHTMGGLNTNTRAQCLDWQGNPIPRLYAAGEITGGIHGTNRVGGNAILDLFVFGQIAGENAAAEKIA